MTNAQLSADIIDLTSDISGASDTNDDSILLVSETPARLPGTANRARGVVSAATHQTPETPDLPSPSLLLQQTSDVGSLGVAGTPTNVAGRPDCSSSSSSSKRRGLSRVEALELPSSPPMAALDDLGEPAFIAAPWNSEPEDLAEEYRTSSPLGDITREFCLDTRLLGGRPRDCVRSAAGSSEATTEILTSSDDEEEERTSEAGLGNCLKRARSMDDEIYSVSSGLDLRIDGIRRELYSDGPGLSGSSSSDGVGLDLCWTKSPAKPPSRLQLSDGRRAGRAQREMERQRQRERRQRDREQTRELRQQERKYQKTLVGINRKRVDPKELLQDTTVVMDPGLFSILGLSDSPDNQVCELLLADKVGWRLEKLSVAGAVRWEMRVRRQWDAELNLYVPKVPPAIERLRSVALVVVDGKRFVDMLVAGRLPHRLEIWRASLAVRKLAVAVVGLQRLLRKAATRETVEETLLRMHLSHPWALWFTQCADTRGFSKLVAQMTGDLALGEYHGGKGDGVGGYESSDQEPDHPQCDNGGGLVTPEVSSALRSVIVRSGTDLRDSWVCALTQIPKVTKPVADSIAARYPTPKTLFDAWDAQDLEIQKEQMLAPLSIASNISSTGGRRLGIVMSARIYHLFNEADPTRPLNEL
ncbi:hypothetical protein LPJ56_001180 [Coemansia sp. RSA 2599]|nr:hypothetical protein LPJ56_001180 [Coemansia sp. RSA 2599]